MQRMGLYPLPPGTSPYPGLEVSGRISAVGRGVTGWQVGDEVCALLTGGGYAQKVAVPAGQLLTVPKGISLVEAAALPEAVATVWSNIVMTARLQEGETLLVHGGAGGVGTMAIQIAKALGARVITTVGSPEKATRARELGADLAIDYRTQEFTARGPYDVILDVIGGQYLERNIRSLAAIVAEVRSQVWPMIENGAVRLVIDQTLPMADAARVASEMRCKSERA
ncbi:zinc-binding dehydrogenase [Nonomuraea zeae]|uniref:Zinc-binding dehydrogenase n=2 Tax=Nonomuraea zeae TaxID=1642303 RepID=A0A5S4GM89_9ACTN|nr:zinc-binding dehydrogenase [Nonomuraea zeae]TMR33993.1 zinc-binding dehydrogenase [Nonomuraea zeae]